ncbi:tRNA(Met) cytidine acetyltransferase TmcA [Haloarcula sp. JP-Z28]|uniref:tRNA(Met) cytidine acetyltransferase TmcA n=1 Tax=Haloarcula sp. JP-Z28 TaxID=2716715 RepID=UPI001877AE23|nr:tRNA(Met) cytidine acetyltransferase TmcA [Haloarcula sp. JP-Z28]
MPTTVSGPIKSVPGERRDRQVHTGASATTGMDIARSLRAEARRANERRLLVLAGDPDRTRERAATALDLADVPSAETTVVGPEPFLDCEHHEQSRAEELLGRTRTAVVLDAHEELRPDAVGRTVGAVDGGGLYVLLAPPLETWPEERDGFDASLAVPPFSVEDVSGHFRRRFVETLRAHRGIAIVDVDTGTVEQDGLTDPPPSRPVPSPTPPTDAWFRSETYAQCLTDDQRDAVQAFESLRDDGEAVVVEADRGRGKSSAAGLAAGNLAVEGRDVLVTAPQYRSAAEVFARAGHLLETLGVEFARDRATNPQRLDVAGAGCVRYAPPDEAALLPDGPDVVIVDEAAALPVRRLEQFLDAPAVAFTTTVHGYEGAGRGFSVRFRDRLSESDHALTDVSMTTPIRYSDADPVEVWAFRALLLDARPPVDQLIEDATPETVEYRQLSAADLLGDEHLLREVFGLLVLAHYRTEPSDLARLLDAPNLTVRALTHEGHVVAVALLAQEGGLSASTRATMYEGGRVRGNMLPDVLSTQLRDEAAGVPVGQRVLRIATHAAVRSRGLGSKLLSEIRAEFADHVDWVGVSYGATPELVRFWADNGYNTVHLATSRNATSGEYSVVMLDPCSDDGAALAARHREWFQDRIAAVLSDPLDDCDPDVVRAVLRATDGERPASLSEWEWRLVAGVPGGASVLDTNPKPFRQLTRRHLSHPADATALSPREERLLVRKVLQAHPWSTVTEELAFVSERECMRTLGGIVERLTRLYGDPWVQEELDRHL